MSNVYAEVFEEVGDTVDLGGLLFKRHYANMIDHWVKKIGRPSVKGEEIPLILSAFMYALLDCQLLHSKQKVKDLQSHMYRALREANDAIGMPVTVSHYRRVNWN